MPTAVCRTGAGGRGAQGGAVCCAACACVRCEASCVALQAVKAEVRGDGCAFVWVLLVRVRARRACVPCALARPPPSDDERKWRCADCTASCLLTLVSSLVFFARVVSPPHRHSRRATEPTRHSSRLGVLGVL
eukprot:6543342-Prymnesium_polylepis.1